MGLSANHSLTLLSKAGMDALEGRRADLNNEKLALMREQQTAALEYNEAMSNTCFAQKNPETGEYEAMTWDENNGTYTESTGALNGKNVQWSLTQEEQAKMDNNNPQSAEIFKRAYDQGRVLVTDADGNQVDLNTLPGLVETYYTADDAEAEAKYQAIKTKIEGKETKLDMDLEQIETEYNAMKTQYESARQLTSQRAQGDFRFFQG